MIKGLIMEALPAVITIIILVISPYVYATLKTILGQKRLHEVEAFAKDIINSILQQYPGIEIEELVSKALESLENKFGLKYFTAEDFENIIRAVIRDLQLNDTEVFNLIDNAVSSSVGSSAEKYLSGKITADKRKEAAVNAITAVLIQAKVPITSELKTIIDSKIDSEVYNLKTPEERKNQLQNIVTQ